MFATAMVSTTPPEADSVKVSASHNLPSNVQTLQDAASQLGYEGFDWLQEITVPTPSPLFACNDPSCSSNSNVSGTYLDPPKFGYDYCNSRSPEFDERNDCSASNPYYYPLTNAINDPSNFCIHFETNGSCIDYLRTFDGTTLNFFDAPADPCLFGGSIIAQLAFCGGQSAPSVSALDFTTELVGVDSAGGMHLLFDFTWIDTFNGTSGGIARTTSDVSVDPGSGTGGITVLEINGAPFGVPEPSTLALLASGIAALGLLTRCKRLPHAF
jgi:hypothetical protein